MAYEHDPGNFSLFRETNPEKYKQNPPSHTGSGKIALPDGTELDVKLACWIKEKKDGTKYFSGRIEEKEHFAPDERPQREDDEDEDIPF